MKIKIKYDNNFGLLALSVVLVLLTFTASIAFALTGFSSISKINVTGSNTECHGVAYTTSTNYVIFICSSNSTTESVRAFAGTNQVGSTVTHTITQGQDYKSSCFPQNTNVVVCAGGELTSNQFRQYTVSGSTFSNSATLSLATCTMTAGKPSTVGTSAFVVCANGDIRRVDLSGFTQTASYSGLTTGLPTCTTPRGITMITSTSGVAICDTNTIISFTLSGSSITKVSSTNLTGTYTSGFGVTGVYSNGYIYFVLSASSTPEAIAITTSSMTFPNPPVTLQGSGNDIAVASGGYWIILDGVNSQFQILNTNTAPPNNIVAIQGIGTTIGAGSRLSSYDGSHFAISKGTNGNSTLFYILSSGLVINDQSPSGNGGSGVTNVDCTDPNFSYRLMCAGNTPLVANSLLLNQSSTNIFCQIGMQHCTQDTNGNFIPDNPNIKTNGIGYMIAVIGFAIMVSIFWMASGGKLTDIPTFVWIIASLGFLASLVAFNFIDPTFLVLGAVAIIALGVVKTRNSLFGDIDFQSAGFKGE